MDKLLKVLLYLFAAIGVLAVLILLGMWLMQGTMMGSMMGGMMC